MAKKPRFSLAYHKFSMSPEMGKVHLVWRLGGERPLQGRNENLCASTHIWSQGQFFITSGTIPAIGQITCQHCQRLVQSMGIGAKDISYNHFTHSLNLNTMSPTNPLSMARALTAIKNKSTFYVYFKVNTPVQLTSLLNALTAFNIRVPVGGSSTQLMELVKCGMNQTNYLLVNMRPGAHYLEYSSGTTFLTDGEYPTLDGNILSMGQFIELFTPPPVFTPKVTVIGDGYGVKHSKAGIQVGCTMISAKEVEDIYQDRKLYLEFLEKS
jgi:hypothetical protein